MKRNSLISNPTKSFFLIFLIGSLFMFFREIASGATVDYDLTIAVQEVNFTGTPVKAMTINGSIPGPVLRFREGDMARIHVTNAMQVSTSIHWHGILVPPGMDGVPFVSFPPIDPGTTFTYEFPIRQNGTYWYHSHSGLQEQRGVYGAIVIQPIEELPRVDRDYVVLFSDWTDEAPHQVLRTLKRGSEWYGLAKGSGQSILGAARLSMLGDYFAREFSRMPPMDIADVAYDRFLANGAQDLKLTALPGETVRLRIIDGSATTYFHLQFAGGPVRVVAADGQEVEPVEMDRLLIGVAETYDVLIRVPEKGAYEFRATAHDGSGFASVTIGDGTLTMAPDVPKPNVYQTMGGHGIRSVLALTPAASMGMGDAAVKAGKFDKPGMAPMEGMGAMGHGMEMGGMHTRDMDGMAHGAETGMESHPMEMEGTAPMQSMKTMGPEKPDEAHMQPGMAAMEGAGPQSMMRRDQIRSGKRFENNFGFLAADASSASKLAVDGMDPERPWTPYEKLRSVKPTALAKDKPVREIRLTLDGDMERYVWFINKKPLSESDVIRIREGEIIRFIMINRTMMHHPMHLHGHFFRVMNGQGDYSPLKHTVDVAPMSTTVIEFAANEVGDWFFHCHLLYHMKSGMARMVHYEEFSPPDEVAAVRRNLFAESWYFWGEAQVMSSMTEGMLLAASTRQAVVAEWEVGWQDVDKSEWEGEVRWQYFVNRFFSAFAGLDVLGEGSEEEHTRGIVGITYLLPLHIESRYWFDTDGGGRFIFEKEFTLTPRLALFGETEYDTHESKWETRSGLSYMLTREVSLIGQWHSDFKWGAGLVLRF